MSFIGCGCGMCGQICQTPCIMVYLMPKKDKIEEEKPCPNSLKV
jgi:hypothetical protein